MSVVSFHDVRLEIVRPGKPHNQLLSPLTPYMALCGEGSPVTFHIGFEHHQLLSRLDRLRYITVTSNVVERVPDRMREAELTQLGEDVARILSDIPTLSTELARAQGNQQGECGDPPANIVHLRLILSGSELALIPFELAVAPQGYPGEGIEFSLQSSLPVVPTREIRRDRPRASCWAQQGAPRILFVSAAPEGLTVPTEAHLLALRDAVEPWTFRVAPPQAQSEGDKSLGEKRLEFVKQRLRLLQNASVEKIYEMCAQEHFTHVHILAHGDSYDDSGVPRFGIALCRHDDPARKEVVSGKRLAKALLAEDAKGAGRSHPLVVTLATCDAGNQAQVLVPGGSIAHQLHNEGISWVVASQFPLTKSGSVRMTQTMYKRLLRGDDPRQMLFELRRELYRSGAHDHDWASIVAYSSVTATFDEEVADYCWAQTRRAINVGLEYADALTVESATANPGAPPLPAPSPSEMKDATGAAEGATPIFNARQEARKVAAEVRALVDFSLGRLPQGDSPHDRLRRAEIIGMHGSTFKRIALLLDRLDDADSEKAYEDSLDAYRRAMDQAASTNDHYLWSWTATQYLSLSAVQNKKDRQTYRVAKQVALGALDVARDKSAKAWAHGSLAELELLSEFHTGRSSRRAIDEVRNHCRQIIKLTATGSFEVCSTMRQFKRYLEYWDDGGKQRRAIAQAAVDILAPAAATPDREPPA